MWNKHLASRTQHYSSGVLSIVDSNGYPLSVRCPVCLNETGHVFTFPTLPPQAARWRGKACLLFHQHNERLEGLKQLVILGELVGEEGLTTFQASKFVTSNGRKDTDQIPHAASPLHLLLVVANSADESAYVPALEAAAYVLRIREPEWYEHRMFRGPDTAINLHVFSPGCPEINRMLLFRNWLRNNASDRKLYERTKRELARLDWKYTQNYADAKAAVVEEILARAREGAGEEAREGE